MNGSENAASIQVRVAEERDAAAIAHLATELGYPTTPEEVRRRFAGLQNFPHQASFIAVTGAETVIGWIHLSEIRSLESEARAEITSLVVGSAFRSGGAGRRLVERGEEWARQRGLAAIGVRSNVTRERAHAFYLRLGYVETKSQKVFRKSL
jgi:GNAT superfamily N-acetyltransferase